jgi:hypothetical protein
MIEIMIGKKKKFIKGDKFEWAIGKYEMRNITNKKTKKVTREMAFYPEQHFSSLEGVIKGALEYKLRMADVGSLEELQMQLQKAKDELKGMYETSV